MIQIHTTLALCAVLLTIAIFSLSKGSTYHRIMGWAWVLMMGGVAISSFGIYTLEWIGPFSPIHLLSVYVLYGLVRSVKYARRGQVAEHQGWMKGMVFGALIVAGAFTLLPGRTMHQVILGG
jgi:uncharacterized membrane protein